MADTGFVLDQRFMAHDTGYGHPERAERIQVLLASVTERPGLHRIAPRAATGDEVTLVHDESHFENVASTSGLERYSFDADTPASAGSFDAACLAVGGLLGLCDEVVGGSARNGFAFVRPPGHHAERGRAMGFCLFNNVAVAAAYLRRKFGLRRILVMDWDVHHGNGTQNAFYTDPGVLYVSTHRYPFYPGTGAAEEVGAGEGRGYTVNIPFPAGFGDAEYLAAFESIVQPIAMQYQPDFVLISAGFDPHARDPLGGMGVSAAGFARMAQSLLAVARESSGDRCVAVLEGGYDLEAIRDSCDAVLAELVGDGGATQPAEAAPHRAAPIIEGVRRIQSDYWQL
jgi:acetoin utilization deacetylase AcuC-like enzyme